MRFIDLSKINITGFIQFDDVRFNDSETYTVYANNEDLSYLAQTMKNGVIIE